jgi:hypothetical protein
MKLYSQNYMIHYYVLNLDVFSCVLYIYVWVKQIVMYCTQLYSVLYTTVFCIVHNCILQMQIRGLAEEEDVYWYKNKRYYTAFENIIFVDIVNAAVKYKNNY